jgi:hypothetical protein
MADSKISALPASTTPLAGTEVLPIVQSSATKQVSVANLTAGRTQTSNGIVQGTAATGYNFTANTPAAGMTSQLLNWYEEGTWTPSLGGSTTYSAQSGTYTRVGRLITVNFAVGVIALGTGSGASISGLPFTSIATNRGGGSVAYVLTPASPFTSINPFVGIGSSNINFLTSSTLGAWTDGDTVFNSGTTITGTVTYMIA